MTGSRSVTQSRPSIGRTEERPTRAVLCPDCHSPVSSYGCSPAACRGLDTD